MDDLFAHALKGLIASGPIALVLLYALRYQTFKLEKSEARIEELHGEKEKLYERVFDLLKVLGG